MIGWRREREQEFDVITLPQRQGGVLLICRRGGEAQLLLLYF